MYYIYWIKRKNYDDFMTEGYIGFSSNVKERFKSHSRNNSRVGNAIRKYDDIVVEKIFEFENEKDALDKEKELRPKKYIGWNIAIGGQKPPEIKNDLDTKRKISKAIKKLKMCPYSELTHAPETLEKASRTKRNNKIRWFHNPETLECKMIRTATEEIPENWKPGRKPKRQKNKNKIRNEDYFCHAHKWKVLSPEGNEYIIKNLKAWCKEKNLNYLTIYSSSKGWKCKKIKENIK
jgi:predicted GIY-YIG superfamily endonuclease